MLANATEIALCLLTIVSCVSHGMVLAAVQNSLKVKTGKHFVYPVFTGNTHSVSAPIIQKVQVSGQFEFGGPSAWLFMSPEGTDLSEQFITALTLPSFGIGGEIRNVTEMVFVQVHVHCAFMYAGAHICRFRSMFNPVSNDLINVHIHFEKVLHFRDATELNAFEILNPFMKAPLVKDLGQSFLSLNCGTLMQGQTTKKAFPVLVQILSILVPD